MALLKVSPKGHQQHALHAERLQERQQPTRPDSLTWYYPACAQTHHSLPAPRAPLQVHMDSPRLAHLQQTAHAERLPEPETILAAPAGAIPPAVPAKAVTAAAAAAVLTVSAAAAVACRAPALAPRLADRQAVRRRDRAARASCAGCPARAAPYQVLTLLTARQLAHDGRAELYNDVFYLTQHTFSYFTLLSSLEAEH